MPRCGSCSKPHEGPAIYCLAMLQIIARGAVRQMRNSLCFSYPTAVSGRQKAAPLGESGGAGRLVGVAVLEMAFRRKVVVHRGMD